MHETDKMVEKVILISIDQGGSPSEDITSENSSMLDELALLAETAGAEVVGRLIQKRESPHPAHYLGKGKMEELKDLVSLTGATGVISDDELSNTQQRNMEKILDVGIMDRTMLILDIFAKHAVTAEGKVQVEAAQLRYRLSHLAGVGSQMSRLAGGIGTRGPGESKLEMDRRYIRSRISQLDSELKEISGQRQLIREKRKRSHIPVISMVGYTNAGKSTLMNALTDAGVLAENKLFATLDTTTRKLQLSGGFTFLFSDTVGFIQKLPHTLIQAFRATLTELDDADALVHVVDASNPKRDEQMAVVYETLRELGCLNKPVITVYNKMDLVTEDVPGASVPADINAVASIGVSAMAGHNIPTLLSEIEAVLKGFLQKAAAVIPFKEGSLLGLVHRTCEILTEEHREDGTYVEIYGPESVVNQLVRYQA